MTSAVSQNIKYKCRVVFRNVHDNTKHSVCIKCDNPEIVSSMTLRKPVFLNVDERIKAYNALAASEGEDACNRYVIQEAYVIGSS